MCALKDGVFARHQPLVGAVPAAHAGEAPREYPAGEEGAELALGEPRQAAAVRAIRRPVIAADTVSAFLVDIEVPKLRSEQVDLVVAKANAEAVTLLAIHCKPPR